MTRLHRHRLPAVGIALVLAGCIPQPAALDPFTPPQGAGRRDVVVFGDSLGAFAEAPARALFAADEGIALSYNAAAGSETIDWQAAMANVDAGDAVVVELGTNDISRWDLTTAGWHFLAAFNELADAACVVVPTLNTTGGDLRPAPFDARTRGLNAWLRDLEDAGYYPNLRLYDWEAESAGHVEWLNLPDPIHHNAEGNLVYAQALVDAAGMCSAGG